MAYNLIGRNEELNALGTGTTFKELATGVLKNLSIPLPPLTVQREIVARLEKELGEADKLAAKFKRVAELADDAFKAELDETFKALEDNSRRDAETRRVSLGDVCEMCLGKMLDKNKNTGLPRKYLRNVNVRWGSFDFSDLLEMRFENDELERYGLKTGDLVVCEGGEPGRCAIWYEQKAGMLIQKALHRLRPSNNVLSEYLYYFFCKSAHDGTFEKYFTGTTIKHLTGVVLRKIQFHLPHLAAQRAIVEKLDAAKERCEKLKAAAMRGLAAAENLRKAILAEAFE